MLRKQRCLDRTSEESKHKKVILIYLVELPKHSSLFELIGLKLDLEEKLKTKVDVVEYGGLKPRIRESILIQQVPIL